MTQTISDRQIKSLAEQVLLGNLNEQQIASKQIYAAATAANIRLSSIAEFYQAIAAGRVAQKLSVPAVNVRGLTMEIAAAIFRAAREGDVGAFIFELARSEMGYTKQPPNMYVPLVLAGALLAGWSGPVFIQGDHYQAKATSSGIPVAGEIGTIKALIDSSLAAGMLNIDIDMSTLVDLEKQSVAEQQIPNIRYTNELVSYIRSLESGIEISVGGELGHIGGTNSTKQECEVFLSQVPGLRKLSIQTGTEHGGVVNVDGSLAKMTVDFNLHNELTQYIRSRFGLAGTVQHGASTLPDEAFAMLPEVKAVEVHLATGIQNLVFDHPAFPQELTEKFAEWIFEKRASERKEGMSDAQLVYRERKRAWGTFKRELWELPTGVAEQISQAIEWRMGEFFNWLGVKGTRSLVDGLITHQEFVPDFSVQPAVQQDATITENLAD